MPDQNPLQPLPENFHRSTAKTTLKFIVSHPIICTLFVGVTFAHELSPDWPRQLLAAYAACGYIFSYWLIVAVASSYCYQLFGTSNRPDSISLLGSQLKDLLHFCADAFRPNHQLFWLKTLGGVSILAALIATLLPGSFLGTSTQPLWVSTTLASSVYWLGLLLGWRLAFMDLKYLPNPFDVKMSILAPSALGVYRDTDIAGITSRAILHINSANTLAKTAITWFILRTALSPLGLAPIVDGVWIAAILKTTEGGSTAWSMEKSTERLPMVAAQPSN